MHYQRVPIPQALELLEEDDWPWDDWLFGFRRAHGSHEAAEVYDQRPPVLITHAELEDHCLVNERLRPARRQRALEWLKARIRSAPRL
jgi:hypothetical protein